MDETLLSRYSAPFRRNSLFVFGVLWLLLFLQYLPTVNAGWVSDTVEWLQKIKHESFLDYVNVKQSRGDLYQFTQIVTYLLYRLFGTNRLPWFLLFITLQAVNASLLFVISLKLLDASGVKSGFIIAGGAAILFCTCPHISEVVVWKASYHYLQGLLMTLCIIYWVQKFHESQLIRYAWYAGIVFLLSTFSHEFFYLTPFFAGSLIVYYRVVLGYDRALYKKALLYFVFPSLIIFLAHFLLIRATTGFYTAGSGDEVKQPLLNYLSKPPLYLFHIIFFGRFFRQDIRQAFYDFFVTKTGVACFYGLLVSIWIYIFVRFKTMTNAGKIFVLIFVWMLMCMALVAPVWFGYGLLVDFDRYAYFMLPFMYLLFLFFLTKIKAKKMAVVLFAVYTLLNVYYAQMVNNYWRQSAHIVDQLEHTLPVADDKIVLLLNVPEYMNGIRMIGPFLHFSFRQMYNLSNERQINNAMYDVVSYNMSSAGDGAHVNVVNDTVLHVTLNQWGTWWWANMRGAFSYENKDYKFDLKDPGHWYELTLKHPASQYLLLYEVGDSWKAVNISKKNVDQN